MRGKYICRRGRGGKDKFVRRGDKGEEGRKRKGGRGRIS